MSGAPVTWTNWGGNQTAHPAAIVRPQDQEEIVAAVRAAIRDGQSLRVVGSGHSFSPLVPTDGLLLDPGAVRGVIDTDRARRRVRVHAATPLAELGPPLWEAGLSLTNQGDVDHQTIAGAIATGTHGSGIDFGSISTALRWVKLVDGHGEVVEIGEDEPERLAAAQVALGAFGVFLELELEVSDRYYLQEQVSFPTWAESVATWQMNIEANRHYSLMWCPSEVSASHFMLRTPTGSMVDRSYAKTFNETTVDDEGVDLSAAPGARLDRAYRIYVSGNAIPPFIEFEYYVPAAVGVEAVAGVRELMLTRFPAETYPIEVRWVKADEGLLSPFFRRDSVVISICGKPGTDYLPFFRAVDGYLRDFDARAHWGKVHFLTRDRVEALYPELPRFREVRQELDPDGVFLNNHLSALLVP